MIYFRFILDKCMQNPEKCSIVFSLNSTFLVQLTHQLYYSTYKIVQVNDAKNDWICGDLITADA